MPERVDAIRAFEALGPGLRRLGVEISIRTDRSAMWSMDGEGPFLARIGMDASDPWRSLSAAVVDRDDLPTPEEMLETLTLDTDYEDLQWGSMVGDDFACVGTEGFSLDPMLDRIEAIVTWMHQGRRQRIYACVPHTRDLHHPTILAREILAAAGLPEDVPWAEGSDEARESAPAVPRTLLASEPPSLDSVVHELRSAPGFQERSAAGFFYEDFLSSTDAAQSVGFALDHKASIDLFVFRGAPVPSTAQFLGLQYQEGVADWAMDEGGLDAIEYAVGMDCAAFAFFMGGGGQLDVARRVGNELWYVRAFSDGYADDALSMRNLREVVLGALGLKASAWQFNGGRDRGYDDGGGEGFDDA